MSRKFHPSLKRNYFVYTEQELRTGSPQWHQWRQGGIASHEILVLATYAKELGLEPIPDPCLPFLLERPDWLGTPRQLFNHKVYGVGSKSEVSGVARWGQQSEAVLRCLNRAGKGEVPVNLAPHCIEVGPIRITVQGLDLYGPLAIGIRTPLKVWQEGPPWHNLIQAQYERTALERAGVGPGLRTFIAAGYDLDVQGGQLRSDEVVVDLYPVKYNRRLGTWLCRIAQQFWKRYVKACVPPPEVASDVRRRSDSDWQHAAAAYRHALKAFEAAEAMLGQARGQLIALTGQDTARHTGDGLSVVCSYHKPAAADGRGAITRDVVVP